MFCSVLGFFWPWGMWDLNSLTRDQNHALWTGRQSFNHWTTKEVSSSSLSIEMYLPFQAQISANSETSGKFHLKQHDVFNKCGVGVAK